MPTRTQYAPGTPSYVDLATTDTAAARDFYGALFGWDLDEEPTDDGGTYIMCTRNGSVAAGMMAQGPGMVSQGMPPMWSSYVTVADADEAVGRVGAAGGSIVMPAMDVMSAGRMAVFADPTGAVSCVWQPRDSIGSEIVNEHGSLTWTELLTPDVATAAAFYAQVFGWTTEEMPMGDGPPYTVFLLDGDGVAGAMNPPMPGIPPVWAVYFAVDDCDATADAATERGATLLAPPSDIPRVAWPRSRIPRARCSRSSLSPTRRADAPSAGRCSCRSS
ncbi:MAG: VOC family protein [Acidimicrobiia bacterium]|nr:VOC family protein [Acidimicrobiia bacterium]